MDMDITSLILMGLKTSVLPQNLIANFIGTVLGIIFGALPGLSGTMGIAVLLPVTYGMQPIPALSFMIAIFCGSLYGGSISAILLHTPGTPAAAATIFDGYPMAQQGRADEALSEAAISSFWGGVASVIALLTIAPPLAAFSLRFGPLENFMIAIFGLTIIASIASKNMLKGLLSGLVGLLMGCVGMDAITGASRYTFDIPYLQSGIGLIVALIGLFSISQVFTLMSETKESIVDTTVADTMKSVGLKLGDLMRYPVTYLRSSIIGIIVGIIPGAGGSIASFLGYNEARRASKHPELFGTGYREGVGASECANNAVSGGALIPMLTLGIPGSTACAVMLGGMMIHGLLPGASLFTEQADVIYPVMCGVFFANVFFLIIGVTCAKYFAYISKTPVYMLAPVITVLCVVGAFAINNSMIDVYIIILFGVLGFFFIRYEFDVTPMVLGLILGPIGEGGLARAIQINKGVMNAVYALFRSPICVVLLVFSVLSIVMPLWREYKAGKKAAAEQSEAK